MRYAQKLVVAAVCEMQPGLICHRRWVDQRQHQSVRIVFPLSVSLLDPLFGRLLTCRPKGEVGSLGPLDWPARVSCFDVLVWLPSAVRHGRQIADG